MQNNESLTSSSNQPSIPIGKPLEPSSNQPSIPIGKSLEPQSGIDQEFDSYIIIFHTDLYTSSSPPHSKYSENYAEIYCYLKGNYVGRIFFADREREKLPMNSYSGGPTVYYPDLWFQFSKFNDIITTLRLEKKVRIFLNRDNLNGGLITGSYEAVGEHA